MKKTSLIIVLASLSCVGVWFAFADANCVKRCGETYQGCMKNAVVKDNPKRQRELEKDCADTRQKCIKDCDDNKRSPSGK